MKKYSSFKTVQLILVLALTVLIVLRFFVTPGLFHKTATDADLKVVSMLLWALLGLNFICLYLDFSFFQKLRRKYLEMETASGTDPVSGIANRYSCDTLIDRSFSRELGPGTGCILIRLSSVKALERSEGNEQLRSFSSILRRASRGLCFVARNGGITFISLFRSGGDESIRRFLRRVEDGADEYNKTAGHPLEFRYGWAVSDVDGETDIYKLLSLADSRLG